MPIRDALSKYVDAEDKGTVAIRDTLGGAQKFTLINELGLYSLILSFKLPQARAFKDGSLKGSKRMSVRLFAMLRGWGILR